MERERGFDMFQSQTSPEEGQKIYTVSALTREIKLLVQRTFPSVYVTGEISNARRYSSGHVYLTLKDEKAQLRAVIWRGIASRLRFEIADGLEVIAFGKIDVYEPRGDYQLIISRLEPKGVGALQLAFEQLKRKLAAEGLFDVSRKRPIPRFPWRIGVVTSPDGAAIRDILNILERRFPKVHILLRPVRVQGDGAAEEIAEGIADLNRWAKLDVIIVGRGGGSLEDLWAFNEEVVARAIAASGIPIISAVGHEIDFTIADFAADLRAATPSEAAERVVPLLEDIDQQLENYELALNTALRRTAEYMRQRLDALAQSYGMRLPLDRVMQFQQRLDELSQRLKLAGAHCLERVGQNVLRLGGRLDSLNPQEVLARGYSVTVRSTDGLILVSTEDVATGQEIRTRLHKGEMESVVSRVSKPDGQEGDR